MSRTYKEHHPTAHNPKNRIPTPYLDKEGKVKRRRKRRAYGSQGWKGWGGETYFKKYGEIMIDVVDKKKQGVRLKNIQKMNYRINYNVVLYSETLYDKEIIVKNKSNELVAKCSLEDYLKRKHGDSFRQLIITRCVPDYFGGANIFNDLFYGRQF